MEEQEFRHVKSEEKKTKGMGGQQGVLCVLKPLFMVPDFLGGGTPTNRTASRT
jgi:hypothetical protein